MKSPLKKKAAGAGSEQDPTMVENILQQVGEGPVVYNEDHESTPPDIIVE